MTKFSDYNLLFNVIIKNKFWSRQIKIFKISKHCINWSQAPIYTLVLDETDQNTLKYNWNTPNNL